MCWGALSCARTFLSAPLFKHCDLLAKKLWRHLAWLVLMANALSLDPKLHTSKMRWEHVDARACLNCGLSAYVSTRMRTHIQNESHMCWGALSRAHAGDYSL